jgi:hypothetical protein
MNLRCRLAARLREFAARLDPPAPDHGDAELEAADRYLELMAHVDAGRVRPRRGESLKAFHRRLIRGDFEINENLIDFSAARARVIDRRKAGAR